MHLLVFDNKGWLFLFWILTIGLQVCGRTALSHRLLPAGGLVQFSEVPGSSWGRLCFTVLSLASVGWGLDGGGFVQVSSVITFY